MASYDFSAPRLYLDQAIRADNILPLARTQHHYLCHVLRLSEGSDVLIFNGRDGEWRAEIGGGRREPWLLAKECRRPQPASGDLHYLFAPLKHARLDYMVQKAVEMGATCLRPVVTRRTQVARVNLDRMRANAIEAAEQCGILTIPDIEEVEPLAAALGGWTAERKLFFCDEDAPVGVPELSAAPGPLAVLVGPEGGFDPDERMMILGVPSACRLSLGPRILRADTAAVAALTLIQSTLGDWRSA